jgi:hypothetical protein
MSSEEDPNVGHASGHSVEEDDEDGFVWSAFGPAGTRQGNATTRAEAEAAAQAAERELRGPRPTP